MLNRSDVTFICYGRNNQGVQWFLSNGCY
ncbi:hypothetical protein BOS5A_220045 [Bosea sp. EC-HK365B]|nr:hypothetical protein BOSE7B_40142 [Bosea sp. 7B]CAD5290321.1 hypothetical protein BOSE21B_60018 [Bosea sp. 21B]VVT60700.1 hypothetical protein BOS5A_220045 [Bosea sp. EC-HK365B]VXB54041.1 hypothetical protein BOSE127_130044 [Bosea sp. 127]